MAGTKGKGPVIALVGNPNVGKSTVFNALTNLRQHTGNWPGKTVETARGAYTYHGRTYTLVDLPGAYSLHPGSAEEEVTRDYLLGGEADVTLVVADATCLERNLALALQILEIAWPAALCVNLLDEAEKKGVRVDLDVLASELGCPVVGAAARGGRGLDELRQVLEETVLHPGPRPERPFPACPGDCGGCAESRAAALMARAKAIAAKASDMDPEAAARRDRRLDRLLTSRRTGIPVMLLLLAGVLWLTMVGANVPSELLSAWLMGWQEPLRGLFQAAGAPWWLEGALVDGVYRTVAWVVSVMLPPMAIFFPLFTLLEDAGYLPRVAFNLDHFFRKAGAHGRQSLTMCMVYIILYQIRQCTFTDLPSIVTRSTMEESRSLRVSVSPNWKPSLYARTASRNRSPAEVSFSFFSSFCRAAFSDARPFNRAVMLSKGMLPI